jgi:hypothetical protein
MPDDLTKPVLDYGAYTLTPVTHNPFEPKPEPKYGDLARASGADVPAPPKPKQQ